MDMTKSNLYREFGRLSLHSIKSVQNGHSLDVLDSYLHVKRPIEEVLRMKMQQIDQVGGGIVLLVGSAGDGKSHLLSKLRSEFPWDEASFYNDATASCSPNKTAVQTLKEALSDFSDKTIDTTTQKMVLAINLGKLNAFVTDSEVKTGYSKIVSATEGIFDDDDSTDEKESDRIKVVLFTKEQMFELYPEYEDQFKVQAPFLSGILEKIVNAVEENPFYKAYLEDQNEENCENNPVYLNYKILQSPQVRDTIVHGIIEAIIRFNLIITPREFLDFIYSIMIYKGLDDFDPQDDYYSALLPTLLYSGGENLIQRTFSQLAPEIYSSTQHDKMIAELYTAYSISDEMVRLLLNAQIPECIINRVNAFYQNNGRQLDITTQFVFRLYHLLDYHSESSAYLRFMNLLSRVFNKDTDSYGEIYEMVSRVLPRHFGSFYAKDNTIPLNVQGGEYKLFANLTIDAQPINSSFDSKYPSRFYPHMYLTWKVVNETIGLKLDYQLYMYLFDLDQGRLVTAYENENCPVFSTFARKLADKANVSEITIVKGNGEEKILKNVFGKVRFA